jgi:DNA-binding transcriptional LysR family regulator
MPIRHGPDGILGRVLDIRDLEALVAVADHGGISAAARELHSTQPALTRRLQRLERQVGLALLERQPTGTRLLAAGRTLVARARPLIDAFEALDALPRAGATLGVLPSTEEWLLPRLVKLLPPGGADTLTPVDLRARDPLQAVRDGEVAAALISDWQPEEVPPGVAVLGLLLEPYVLLCRPGHRLLSEQAVDARGLRAEHVVSAPHPDCGGRLAETGLSQRMAGSLAHAHALAASTASVALWPSCTSVAPGPVARAIGDRTVARRLGLAVDARALRSPALRPLVDAIAEAVRRRRRGRSRPRSAGAPRAPGRCRGSRGPSGGRARAARRPRAGGRT